MAHCIGEKGGSTVTFELGVGGVPPVLARPFPNQIVSTEEFVPSCSLHVNDVGDICAFPTVSPVKREHCLLAFGLNIDAQGFVGP